MAAVVYEKHDTYGKRIPYIIYIDKVKPSEMRRNSIHVLLNCIDFGVDYDLWSIKRNNLSRAVCVCFLESFSLSTKCIRCCVYLLCSIHLYGKTNWKFQFGTGLACYRSWEVSSHSGGIFGLVYIIFRQSHSWICKQSILKIAYSQRTGWVCGLRVCGLHKKGWFLLLKNRKNLHTNERHLRCVHLSCSSFSFSF